MLRANQFFSPFLKRDNYERPAWYKANKEKVWLIMKELNGTDPTAFALQAISLIIHCDMAAVDLLNLHPEWLNQLNKPWQMDYLLKALQLFITNNRDEDYSSRMIPNAINALVGNDKAVILTILRKYSHWLNFLNIERIEEIHKDVLKSNFSEKAGKYFCRYLLERLKTHETIPAKAHIDEAEEHQDIEADVFSGMSPW